MLATLIVERIRIHSSLLRRAALYRQHAASAAHHPRPLGIARPYPDPSAAKANEEKTQQLRKWPPSETTRALYRDHMRAHAHRMSGSY